MLLTSVELVQFMSVVESNVHTNIYTLSLLKINAVDCERTFLFFAEFISVLYGQKYYILVKLTAFTNLQYLLQQKKNAMLLLEESAEQQNTFFTATGVIHSCLNVKYYILKSCSDLSS